MAKYTIELRRICDIYSREIVENWFKDYEISDYLTQEQINIINKANLWNKDKLAKKIVDHYFMREIGFETPALFQHYVKVTMQELMEEKLPLIYSNSIEYDPLVNVDFTETFERDVSGEGTNNSNSSGNSTGLNVISNTPQGQINKAQLLQGKYASDTSASENEASNNSTSNSNSSSNETYTKHMKGNSGVMSTAQKLIEQYRKNIIAIDKDIIKELDSLFMGLY